MTLTEVHLTELRNYLKEFKAFPKDEADAGKAETINALIPALVETMTDEELTGAMNGMWSTIMTGIIQGPEEDPASTTDVQPPLVQLN